mgnify:CR=1 FL=1
MGRGVLGILGGVSPCMGLLELGSEHGDGTLELVWREPVLPYPGDLGQQELERRLESIGRRLGQQARRREAAGKRRGRGVGVEVRHVAARSVLAEAGIEDGGCEVVCEASSEVTHGVAWWRRTGVDDLRALASILIQADKFGSSVGQALRVQSDSMRTRRRQLAEEKAAKTAVQLIFPLVLFIFPGIFVVLVGPAAITMINNFFPMMESTGGL